MNNLKMEMVTNGSKYNYFFYNFKFALLLIFYLLIAFIEQIYQHESLIKSVPHILFVVNPLFWVIIKIQIEKEWYVMNAMENLQYGSI